MDDFKTTVDLDRAAMLLGIVKDVSTVAPGYTSLSSAAMSELKAMNDVCLDEAKAYAQAKADEAHTAQQAKLAADNEANEAAATDEDTDGDGQADDMEAGEPVVPVTRRA